MSPEPSEEPCGAVETPATAVQRPNPGLGSRILAKAAAYFALTKPRVIELLLVTTVPVMVLAAHGIPNLWLVLAHPGRREA